jgi:hypothetical protein
VRFGELWRQPFLPDSHFQSCLAGGAQSAGLAAEDLSPYYKPKQVLRTSSVPIAAAMRHCGTSARVKVQNRWRMQRKPSGRIFCNMENKPRKQRLFWHLQIRQLTLE